jgi:hypothetical protein
MGIRTPDFLHAMERRTAHGSPRQFTRDPSELAICPEQVTSVHESSLRTVTSLVTSRRAGQGTRPDIALRPASGPRHRDLAAG